MQQQHTMTPMWRYSIHSQPHLHNHWSQAARHLPLKRWVFHCNLQLTRHRRRVCRFRSVCEKDRPLKSHPFHIKKKDIYRYRDRAQRTAPTCLEQVRKAWLTSTNTYHGGISIQLHCTHSIRMTEYPPRGVSNTGIEWHVRIEVRRVWLYGEEDMVFFWVLWYIWDNLWETQELIFGVSFFLLIGTPV